MKTIILLIKKNHNNNSKRKKQAYPFTLLGKQASFYIQLVEMSDQNIYLSGVLYLPTLIKQILHLVNMLKKFLL